MSKYRLTILVDNRADTGLISEHGFALFMETPAGNVLLDSGQNAALLPNARTLGIELDQTAILVLSHGHYDHTGGVVDLLELNKSLEIYLHSGVFQPRYSLGNDTAKIIKMPLTAMEAIMHHPDSRVHWLTRPTDLHEGIGITGPIPRNCTFEDTGGKFFLDPEGKEIDIIRDDNAIWLQGKNGLTICLGCCHAGLLNTLDYIVKLTGEKRIDTIIGGLHLLQADESRLNKTADRLRRFDIRRITACHCSGAAAIDYLASHLSCEVIQGYAGMAIDV